MHLKNQVKELKARIQELKESREIAQKRASMAEAYNSKLVENLREEVTEREIVAETLKRHFEAGIHRAEETFQAQLKAMEAQMGQAIQDSVMDENTEAMVAALSEAEKRVEGEKFKASEAMLGRAIAEERYQEATEKIRALEAQLAPFLEASGNYYLASATSSAAL